jgi:H+/Cl- antiporter ClcA
MTNLSLAIRPTCIHIYNYLYNEYMTSIQQSDTPSTASATTHSRTILYTLSVASIAIIALFIPSLLRGRSLGPQITNITHRYFPQVRQASTHTMSEVKLSPREVKEWNVYVVLKV